MSSFDLSVENVLYHQNFYEKIIRRVCIRCEVIHNNEKDLTDMLSNKDDVFLFRSRRIVYETKPELVPEIKPTANTKSLTFVDTVTPLKSFAATAADLLAGTPSGNETNTTTNVESMVDFVNDSLGYVVGQIDM
jgi:hypothetical protein